MSKVGLFVLFQLQLHAGQDVVVYDQNSADPSRLGPESFLSVVLLKLERTFSTVHLLSGQSPVRRASATPLGWARLAALGPPEVRWLAERPRQSF